MSVKENEYLSNTKAEYRTIGNIAECLNISTRTIRYYEELGLIFPKRSNGGYREYSKREIDKLKTILRLKKLGLSLDEIKKMNDLKDKTTGNEGITDLLEFLHKRLHEFENKVTEYQAGIREIESAIELITNCSKCKQVVNMWTCDTCKERMPSIVKSIL